MRVTGLELRRVRMALGESQGQFGARFGKTRRTVIRWEQTEAHLSEWHYPSRLVNGRTVPRDKSEWNLWGDAQAEAVARQRQREDVADDAVYIVEWTDANGHHAHTAARVDAYDIGAELAAFGVSASVRPDLVSAVIDRVAVGGEV